MIRVKERDSSRGHNGNTAAQEDTRVVVLTKSNDKKLVKGTEKEKGHATIAKLNFTVCSV